MRFHVCATRYRHVYNLIFFSNIQKHPRNTSALFSRIPDEYTQRSPCAERLGVSVTRARLHAESASAAAEKTRACLHTKSANAAAETARQAKPARTPRALKMQNNTISQEEALETRLKITTHNADQFLEYHEAYSVLICVKHGYAVRNLAHHLSRNHIGSKKERGEVTKRYKSLVLSHARDTLLPPPLEQPFPALGKPQKGFICQEPECQYISISRKGIRLHCNQKHDWKSSAEQREN